MRTMRDKEYNITLNNGITKISGSRVGETCAII